MQGQLQQYIVELIQGLPRKCGLPRYEYGSKGNFYCIGYCALLNLPLFYYCMLMVCIKGHVQAKKLPCKNTFYNRHVLQIVNR